MSEQQTTQPITTPDDDHWDLGVPEWSITIRSQGRTETIAIKPGCCLKFREPGKVKCTGCPCLKEHERLGRLITRLDNQEPKPEPTYQLQ